MVLGALQDARLRHDFATTVAAVAISTRLYGAGTSAVAPVALCTTSGPCASLQLAHGRDPRIPGTITRGVWHAQDVLSYET
jgi:hypothetical protein